MSQITPTRRVLFVRRYIPALLILLGVFSLFTLNLSAPHLAEAATSSNINFQARLEAASGAIAPDGNYNVTFKLYSGNSCTPATGANCTQVWTETYQNSSGTGVRVVNGYLSVALGSVNAFSNANPAINWDQQLWLSMNIGGTSTGASPTFDGEMKPYLQLTSVPYAFRAGQLAQYNATTGYTSTLNIVQPTGGNQIFQIPDQGAQGTYNLLTTSAASTGFIQLQGTTPGTAQIGNFNINGQGVAAGFTANNAGVNYAGNGSIQLTGTGTNFLMGALGLGTSNPQSGSALTVTNGAWISSIDASGTGYINMFQVNSSNQIQVGASLNVDGYIVLPTNGGQMTFSDLPIDISAAAGTPESYSLRVGSSNALTVYGEADGNGNAQNIRIAIGASITPQYTLDIGGDVNTTGVYRKNGVAGVSATCAAGNSLGGTVVSGGIITGGTCGAVAPASGSGFYIQNNNGGGGTQSAASFTIDGTGAAANLNATTSIQINGTTRIDNNANIVNIGNITGTNNVTLQGGSNGNVTLQANGTGVLALATAGGTAISVNTTGNVGIGTTTPGSYKLNVNGSANATTVYQNGNQVCDASGNCAGTGTGGIGGGGTANKIALFTGSGYTIGNSILSQDAGATTITASGNLNVNGIANLLGTTTNVGGALTVGANSGQGDFVQFTDTFDGTTFNTNNWFNVGSITQNGNLQNTGDGSNTTTTGFNSMQGYRRTNTLTLSLDVITSSSTTNNNYYVGFGPNATGMGVSNMMHAVRFNAGSLQIYENNINRGVVGTYNPSTTYRVRIAINATGARYYISSDGGNTWTKLYDGTVNNITTSPLFFREDNVGATVATIDNVSISNGQDVLTNGQFYDGNLTLGSGNLNMLGGNIIQGGSTTGNILNTTSVSGALIVGANSSQGDFVQFTDTFDGTTINTNNWTPNLTTSQNGKIIATGNGSAPTTGIMSVQGYRRTNTLTLTGDVVPGAPTSGNPTYFGFASTSAMAGGPNNMPHAVAFSQAGTISILENNTLRVSSYVYTGGTTYRIRISVSSTGARYYISTNNGNTWMLLYDGTANNVIDSPLYIRFATQNTNTSTLDNVSVSNGQDVLTNSQLVDGNLTLGNGTLQSANGAALNLQSGTGVINLNGAANVNGALIVGANSSQGDFVQFTDTFDGSTINTSNWSPLGSAVQNGNITITGDGTNWTTNGITSTQGYRRNNTLTFSADITPSSVASTQNFMVGLSSVNGTLNYTNMPHALQFFNGNLSVYENGSLRGVVGSYVASTTYRVRIAVNATGARYYISSDGGNTYKLLYDGSVNNITNPSLFVRLVSRGTSTVILDNVSVSNGYDVLTNGQLIDGNLTLGNGSLLQGNATRIDTNGNFTGGTFNGTTLSASTLGFAASGQNYITTMNGSSSAGTWLNISAGNGAGGNFAGGTISIYSGNASGTATGGQLVLKAGDASANAGSSGGSTSLFGGNTSTSGASAGSVTIMGGSDSAATSGSGGGNVTINGGSSTSGAAGVVTIGNTSSGVTIGKTGGATTINGITNLNATAAGGTITTNAGGLTSSATTLTLQGASNTVITQGSSSLTVNSSSVNISSTLSINNGSNQYEYRNVFQAYVGGASTGTYEIAVPNGWNNAILHFELRGNDLTGSSAWSVKATGSPRTASSSWASTEYEISGGAPFNSVRFGYDSALGKPVLLLGTTLTSWSYFTLNMDIGVTGPQAANYATGFSGAFLTSEANITTPVTGNTMVNSPFVQGGNSFGQTAFIGTTDANNFAIRTGTGGNGAQTRVVIDSTGNVGIGTGTSTSGASILDVAGTISTSGSANQRSYINAFQDFKTGVNTGTYEIVLPNTWSGSAQQLRFVIDGNDNSGTATAWQIIMAATQGSGNVWGNGSVEIRGSAPFTSARFAYDTSLGRLVLLLGTPTSQWQGEQVVISTLNVSSSTSSNLTSWGNKSAYSSAYVNQTYETNNITSVLSPTVYQTLYSGASNGDFSTGNQYTKSYQRTLPTNVGDSIGLGSFTSSYNSTVHLDFSSNAINGARSYVFSTNSSNNTGGWRTVVPLTDSGFSANDFAIDINTSSGNTVLRLRRILGTTGGTGNFTMTTQAANDGWVPDSSGTITTGSTVIGYFGASTLSQKGGQVTIVGDAPTIASSGTLTMQSASSQSLILGSGTNTALTINSSNNVVITNNLTVTGDLSTGYNFTKSFSRPMPTNVGEALDLGSFSSSYGSIQFTVASLLGGNVISKQYNVSIRPNATGGVWQIVAPSMDAGTSGSNDVAVDINSGAGTTTLRVRRISGTTASTVNVSMNIQAATTTDPWSIGTNTSAAVTAPTQYYATSIATQSMSGLTLQGSLVLSNNGTIFAPGLVSSSTGFYAAGVSGGTFTCSGGTVLQNAVISGGIVGSGTCATVSAASITLQNAYSNYGSSSAIINLVSSSNSGPGGVIIQDSSTPIAGDLFTVQSNGGGTQFLRVNNSGAIVGGTLSATALQSATLDIASAGNLSIGNGAVNHSIYIGNNSNGAQVINVGSTTVGSGSTFQANGDSSSLYLNVNEARLQTGADNINLFTNGSGNGTVVRSQTNSTTAFQIQNSNGTSGVLFNADTATSSVTVSTPTASSTAFQVLNSYGSPIFLVDTLINPSGNMITNGGFEAYPAGSPATASGWTATGSASISRNTVATNHYGGVASLQLGISATAAGQGAVTSSFTTPPSNVASVLSFYVQQTAGTVTNGTTFRVQVNGSTNVSCTSPSANFVLSGGFVRVLCPFTPGATITSIAIQSTLADSVARTFYIDAVQLVAGSTATASTGLGGVQLRGAVTSPVVFQAMSNSTTAFQIQNTAGTSNLFVADTVNNQLTLGGSVLASTINIGTTGTGTVASTTNIGNTTSGTGVQTTTIGSSANVNNAVSIEAGNTGKIQIGNGTTAHQIFIGNGGTSAQVVSIGSTSSTSYLNLLGSASANTTTNGVRIGQVDANQTNLVLDNSSTYTEAVGCTSNIAGAMYYNTTANAIRSCIGTSWEDVVTTSGLGIIAYGVVPDTGTTNPGDLAGAAGYNSGPCKAYVGTTANLVFWTGCTAYSQGRKIVITANTTGVAVSSTANAFQNLCVQSAGAQPTFGTASTTETSAALPSFTVGTPALCLATVKTSSAGTSIAAIYDTRTYTTNTKTFATIASTTALGTVVKSNGTAGQYAPIAATSDMALGVVVAYSGTTSTTTPNAVIVTAGPIAMKATAGSVGAVIQSNGAAGGYTLTGSALLSSVYTNFGVALNAYSGVAAGCSVSTSCSGSLFTIFNNR